MQQNWGVVDDIGVYGRDDTAYYLLRVMKKLQNFFNEIFWKHQISLWNDYILQLRNFFFRKN